MLIETGRVVAVDAQGLWVETIRQSTCGSCAARSGCGHGLLNRMSDGRQGYIRVLPGDQSIESVRINDQVLIGTLYSFIGITRIGIGSIDTALDQALAISIPS